MKKLDRNKMIFWEGWQEGNIQYYTRYTIVKTPMWIYKLFYKLEKLFGKLKQMTWESWEADWETPKEKPIL